MHKNSEGYPDQTQGDAINGVRREERQRALERKHGYSRGQQIVIEAKVREDKGGRRIFVKKEGYMHSKTAFPVLYSFGGQAWTSNLPKLCQIGSNAAGRGRGIKKVGGKTDGYHNCSFAIL